MTTYTFEEEVDMTFYLTVFGIGTAGIETTDHLSRLGVRNIRSVACHSDKTQLWASYTGTKLLYEPDSEQDILADLRQMLPTSAVTILILDLAEKESWEIALKAAQTLDEQGACYVVASPKPDVLDPAANAVLTQLQRNSNGVLMCRTEMIGPVSRLALTVQNVCMFCEVLTSYDLPDIREILPSSGRMIIVAAAGNGPDRVNNALQDVTKQLIDCDYDYRKASRMLLHTHFPDRSWIDSEDWTILGEKSKRLPEKEPEVFKHGSIIDRTLSDEIVVELLLWFPV